MNIPTIIVLSILAAVVALILWYMYRSKKNGSSCSCGSSCSSSCASCSYRKTNAQQDKKTGE